MSYKVHKKLLSVAVSVAVYVTCALVIDIALVFLLEVHGWPLTAINVVVAAVCGYKVARWNDRQDDLEQQRSEVDS